MGPYRESAEEKLEFAVIESSHPVELKNDADERLEGLRIVWSVDGHKYQENVVMNAQSNSKFRQLCAAVSVEPITLTSYGSYFEVTRLTYRLEWRACMVERRDGRIVAYRKCDSEVNRQTQRAERRQAAERILQKRDVEASRAMRELKVEYIKKEAEREAAAKLDELRDRFMMAALQAIIAKFTPMNQKGVDDSIEKAYKYADAAINRKMQRQSEEEK